MKSRKEILSHLINILNRQKNYYILEEMDKVNESTGVYTDLSMDSIQILELLTDVEDDFSITFDFQNLSYRSIETLGNLIDLIEATQ